MQKTYDIHDVKCATFVRNFTSDIHRYIGLITPYQPKSNSVMGDSLYIPPTFFRSPILGHLCTMPSICSKDKNFIIITQDSFKDYILASKSENQVHAKLKAVTGILLKNGCSVIHMFCKIFASVSVAKIFEITFEVVHSQ